MRIKENIGSFVLIIFGYLLGQVDSVGEQGDEIGMLIMILGVINLFRDYLYPTESTNEEMETLARNPYCLIGLLGALIFLIWFIFILGC